MLGTFGLLESFLRPQSCICWILSMIVKDRIGQHEVLVPISHNFKNKRHTMYTEAMTFNCHS